MSIPLCLAHNHHVISSWLAFFATFGAASSFGVYQDFYVRAGTSTSSNIAWIGSVQLSLLIGMGLLTGKLLDKGYFRSLVLTGSIIMIFRFVQNEKQTLMTHTIFPVISCSPSLI